MDFKQDVIEMIAKSVDLKKSEIENLIEIPPNQSMGDFAFPCFILSKKMKKSPVAIAQELAPKMKLKKTISKVVATGPYLNFFVNTMQFYEVVLKGIFKKKEKYGKSKQDKETVMVEFFHANTHKGVHIGHLRNISLGSALCNTLEAVGKKVIRVNYQGDIGPHVAKCIWGYKNAKDKPPKKHKGIWLGKKYAEGSTKAKENKKVEEEIKQLNIDIYNQEKSVKSLWEKTRKWCLDDFNDFYKQFGVKYDRLYFESESEAIGKKIAHNLVEKKIAKKDDGALIVDLKEYGLNIYVVVTGQGYGTYHAKDLGLSVLKQKEFSFDKSIHVVGSEQEMYFKQIFKTFELMKSPLAKKSVHVSYGLVMLPEGKMSSREGTMILYHNLFTKLLELSTKEIVKRHKDLSKKEVEKRAEMIAFGALKYSMIARENRQTLTFDWNKALDFDGDTGPYIQYAHARCASILRKSEEKINTKVHFESLDSDHEKRLITLLSQFEDVIVSSAQQYKPYLIAKYVLDVAQRFNEFYHHCPVLTDLTEVKHARLLLVSCVKQVLSNGLTLLGMSAPERM